MTIREMERNIADVLLTQLFAVGFYINLNNGGDGNEFDKPCRDKGKVLEAMFATGSDRLLVYGVTGYTGFVDFAYGNGGWDVISDYSLSLEPFMVGANNLSEQYSNLEPT